MISKYNALFWKKGIFVPTGTQFRSILVPKLPFSCTFRFHARLHYFQIAKFFPKMCFLFGPFLRHSKMFNPMVYIYYLPVNCIRLTVSGSTHFSVTSLFRMNPQAFWNFLNSTGYFIFISPNPQNLLKRIRLISQNIANIPNDISLWQNL